MSVHRASKIIMHVTFWMLVVVSIGEIGLAEEG